jgi:chromosome partitioning protein
MFYTLNKVTKIYQTESSEKWNALELKDFITQNNLIAPHLDRTSQSSRRGYSNADLVFLGEKIGFLKKPKVPKVLSLFVTKGGVLKTSLTLNVARMAALHGIRTLVIGLDMQGDISNAIGYNHGVEEEAFESAIERIDQTQGLADVFLKRCQVTDTIVKTDLPTLDLIPETPELVALEQGLIHKARRELWLKEHVIAPLKSKYDLFVIDCSPNWNQLITNALSASDILLSPLECKINNYRNFQMFRSFVSEFIEEMNLSLQHLYIPTRWTQSRKLSTEIKEWYLDQVADCVPVAIRDSVAGEEATAMHLSVAEYDPGSNSAIEMNEALKWVWQRLVPETHNSKTKPNHQLEAEA